jgi:hypothetical protein
MIPTYRDRAFVVVALFTFGLATTDATAEFTTGFESPTYVSGALEGQDSWTSGAAGLVQTESEIATLLTNAGLNAADGVHGGSQALIVSGTGGSSASVRPITGLETANRAILDMWARPLTPGAEGSEIGSNVGNMFVMMEDPSGPSGRAAGFRFGGSLDDNSQLATTSIDVYTEGTGWMPTGVEWQADTWYNVRLDADYIAKTYDVIIDSTEVQSDVPFFNPDATNLSQIRIFRGSGQAGMIADDLFVVPEPSAVALAVTAAGLALLTRRKSRCS